MDENKLSSISKANTNEAIGAFWDTHDFTGFDTDAPDVAFEVVCSVPIEAILLSEIEKQADQNGVKVEELVNSWLRQKLAEQTAAQLFYGDFIGAAPYHSYSQATNSQTVSSKSLAKSGTGNC